jgi:hypothetical protein
MRRLVYLLAITCITACATAYQAKGFTGGYSDRKLDDNTVFVTFPTEWIY